MALGKVSVNNLNLGQGAVTEIERYFLFIGPGAKSIGSLIALNTDSDLDVVLGQPVSDLKPRSRQPRPMAATAVYPRMGRRDQRTGDPPRAGLAK